MNPKDSASNVISLDRKIGEKRGQRHPEPPSKRLSRTKIVAITSGKGGVGKTNIVANLGILLSRLGKKVLIFDADLGLGNLDILLGLAPRYNLSHVILGERSISEIIVQGPESILILPASSGIQELTQLAGGQMNKIIADLESLIDPMDIMLIDTAAGISSNVMYFNANAHEIMVVVSPEPTSITDAYALMKVLSMKYAAKRFKLLVNMATDVHEANEVFRQLSLVADRFLDISLEYIGHVFFDANVTKGVKQQRAVSDLYPNTRASKCLQPIAEKLCQLPAPENPQGSSLILWKGPR